MVPLPWIVTSLLVGVLLVFAPWWPLLWDSNWLLQAWPPLRAALLSPFFRGAVTGLGLVNVLLALHDALARLAGADDEPAAPDERRGFRGFED